MFTNPICFFNIKTQAAYNLNRQKTVQTQNALDLSEMAHRTKIFLCEHVRGVAVIHGSSLILLGFVEEVCVIEGCKCCQLVHKEQERVPEARGRIF